MGQGRSVYRLLHDTRSDNFNSDINETRLTIKEKLPSPAMQKVVIVGFGFMGSMHAQVYHRLPNARLVGVIDYPVDKVESRLAELGFDVPVFESWEAAVSKIEFDVVDVCTPTELHLEYAKRAAETGKALFCEKPLAIDEKTAQEIVSIASEAGIIAQVGHCIRYWPEYVALRNYIKSGKGGRLLSLTLQRRTGGVLKPGSWLNEEERSGGAAMDLHIHDTDYVLSLFGTPTAVDSRCTFDAAGPSHIWTRYIYPDNIVVEAEGGWNYPDKWGFQMAFQAVFENAAIEYDSSKQPTFTIVEGNGERQAMEIEKPQTGESKLELGNISDLGGYYNELASFIDCVETGKAVTQATLEQGAESVAVVRAEVKSARLGKPVDIRGLVSAR